MSIQDAVNNFFKTDAICQFAFLNPAEIPFSERVREACRVNYCGRYGLCWTCPPGAGEWEALREHCLSYPRAAVFTTLHGIEDSFDIEGMDEARKLHEKAEDNLLSQIKPWKGTFELLGAGSCTICEKCTYPDAPCRFPDKARRSVEACGIDVVALSQKNRINYFNGANTVTYFSVLLY